MTMEMPTTSERSRSPQTLPRMEERPAPRGLDATGTSLPRHMAHDTMRPFHDARGVGRVWCSLVAFPMFQ